MIPELPAQPIDDVLPQLHNALARHPAAVLQAPPGAGKTTRVPPALLDADWLAGKRILMLEPRRLAATNAARYMAQLRGERVGAGVGYRIRYEQAVSQATRIEIVTEGILIRRLQGDPELKGVGLVVFDEFHERNLNSDLALALCRDVQLGLRDDLKILVMSATLDAEPVARLLGDAPLITSAGRSYPVDIRYLENDPNGDPARFTAAAVRRALNESVGDLLVFLPGTGEINRCARELENLTEIDIRPLYGNLPFDRQEAAIRPGPRRRVVLATNIAETSLTIEGISTVIDSGLERRPRFAPERGFDLLERVRISQAGATQRAGRAGRLGPGTCYRLWSEGTQGTLLPFTPPEIAVADLTPLALDLLHWGVRDAGQLTWLDAPSLGRMQAAREQLRLLGALDDKDRLTPRGKDMARLPTHPRNARLLLAGQDHGKTGLAIELVTLLDQRRGTGDTDDLLTAVQQARQRPSTTLKQARKYWHQQLQASELPGQATAEELARLLAEAWPDRLGRRRKVGNGRYLLANGRGARLRFVNDAADNEWLLAVDAGARPGDDDDISLALSVPATVISELYGDVPWQRDINWDARDGRLRAREVRRIGALIPAGATAQGDSGGTGPSRAGGAGTPRP